MYRHFTVAHELPKRIRIRWPRLRQPRYDADYIVPCLQAIAGVERVRIEKLAGSLTLDYNGADAVRSALFDEIAAIDRDPQHCQPFSPEVQPQGGALDRVLLLGGLLVATPFLPLPVRAALTLASITPALMNGVKTLLQRGVKGEVLDAASVSVSAIQGDYFTANATHFMLEMGEYLEDSTASNSDKLLAHLMQPEAGPVTVMRDEQALSLPAEQLRVGDTVVVGAGDRIPIDGNVIKGSALVNQANMTGESLPVKKSVGDRALSGTVLTEGQLFIWAERVGSKTATAKISRFIANAVQNKGDMQRLTESLSNKLVPLTLGLSGLTFAATRDLTRTASVLQADYACALKLATPVAIKSAIYNGARNGILIKGGQAFEGLAAADTFVFDKTGTLTHSQLEVSDVISLTQRWDSGQILNLAASAEEHYFHPVAEAVVRAAANQPFKHIDHGEVDFIVAHGITTEVNGETVVIGSQHYLEDHHQIAFDSVSSRTDALRAAGKTLLFIAMDQQLIGVISLLDQLRDDTLSTLTQLKSLGVKRIVMLTGDHRTQAQNIAKGLPIDEVHYELEPEDKVAVIQRLQAQGCKVAFVGDGVNDAPALTCASVGISMQYGADIAREIADVSLLVDRLSAVADARALATATMKTVTSNFRMSVGFNSLILLAASANLLSPIATSLLHNGTTLGMLACSIKLRKQNLDLGRLDTSRLDKGGLEMAAIAPGTTPRVAGASVAATLPAALRLTG